MNNDENYFRQKFQECAKFLKVKPSDLISLKYREMRDHHYYNELLTYLRDVKGLNIEDIGHVLNGQAYIVSYGDQEIVLVEHETGLEILYIAGSIASLIGLILQISSMVNKHLRHMDSFPPYSDDVEIRRFDKAGKFIEEHRHHYLPYEVFLLPSSNSEVELLKKRIATLEKKLNKLSKRQVKKEKR
jgi:hypothetical protein